MGAVRFFATVGVVAALTSACATPPVKPVPEAVRRNITSLSGDVSGLKDSDTSKLGARGSAEGASRGAMAGAAAVATSNAGLLSLLLLPVGAAVGSATGASAAKSEDVVDAVRGDLRIAIQETDFNELLRSRLASSKVGGDVEIVAMGAGSATAAVQGVDGAPASHLITIEYRLNIYGEGFVNPKVGIFVHASAQVLSADRKQVLHAAAWNYCGERHDWVEMAANQGAALRAQIDNAATVLAEAIPHDLFVNKNPRYLTIKGACMDFGNLPSGIGNQPGPAKS